MFNFEALSLLCGFYRPRKKRFFDINFMFELKKIRIWPRPLPPIIVTTQPQPRPQPQLNTIKKLGVTR